MGGVGQIGVGQIRTEGILRQCEKRPKHTAAMWAGAAVPVQLYGATAMEGVRKLHARRTRIQAATSRIHCNPGLGTGHLPVCTVGAAPAVASLCVRAVSLRRIGGRTWEGRMSWLLIDA
eukprot:364422-Chlamydomonas_euryale.AAC.2